LPAFKKCAAYFLKEAKAASLQLRSPAGGRGESAHRKLCGLPWIAQHKLSTSAVINPSAVDKDYPIILEKLYPTAEWLKAAVRVALYRNHCYK
jgi:hypothetical protein